MSQSSMTLLNRLGDITFTWDRDNEAVMLSFIEEKLAQGYSFFTITHAKGFFRTKTTLSPITGIEDLKDKNEVRMFEPKLDDQALEALVKARNVSIARVGSGQEKTLGQRLTDPKQIVKTHSMGVRPIHAG